MKRLLCLLLSTFFVFPLFGCKKEEPVYYTVTFEYIIINNTYHIPSSTTGTKQIRVKEGNLISDPKIVTQSHFPDYKITTKGWFQDENKTLPWLFYSDKVYGDTTLYSAFYLNTK